MKRNNLDEMQEQKLLRIEHNGCWLAFWGLLAVMAVETVVYDFDVRRTIGEWVVFMTLALYLGIDCARNGIWDRRLKPNARTNLIVSMTAAAAAAAFMFAGTYLHYAKPVGSLAAAAITGTCAFGVCFGALTLAARYVKRKQTALEKEPEDEEEE